jgi:hypothetical protein
MIPNLIIKNNIKEHLFGKYHYTIILLVFILFIYCLYIKYITKPCKKQKYKTLLDFYNKVYN